MHLFRKKPLEDDLSPEFEGYAVASIITVSSQLSNLNNKAALSWCEFKEKASRVQERLGPVCAWGVSERFEQYNVDRRGRGWYFFYTSSDTCCSPALCGISDYHRAKVVRTYCTYGRYKGKVGLWLRPYDQEDCLLWQGLKLYTNLSSEEDVLLKNILYDLNRGSYEPK